MANARLVPCSSCARHVRASEEACPFCSATLPELPATPTLAAKPRTGLKRAALFAIGTTVAACSSSSSSAVYGGPPVDAGVDAGADGPVDTPAYGGPAFDASDDAPILVDAAYGGPPQDSGDAGDGGD